jgi:[acyl-carrier-protein] S-malonyltransferase
MQGALEGLIDTLKNTPFNKPEVPVYTNVDANPENDPEKLRLLAQRGLLSPVRWEEIIKNMIKNGISKTFELGPGKVLCGLGRRIEREFECQTIDQQADFEKLN